MLNRTFEVLNARLEFLDDVVGDEFESSFTKKRRKKRIVLLLLSLWVITTTIAQQHHSARLQLLNDIVSSGGPPQHIVLGADRQVGHAFRLVLHTRPVEAVRPGDNKHLCLGFVTSLTAFLLLQIWREKNWFWKKNTAFFLLQVFFLFVLETWKRLTFFYVLFFGWKFCRWIFLSCDFLNDFLLAETIWSTFFFGLSWAPELWFVLRTGTLVL